MATNSPARARRVLIIDDHVLTREGCSAVLSRHEGVDVVAAVTQDAARRVAAGDVDVLLLAPVSAGRVDDELAIVKLIGLARACRHTEQMQVIAHAHEYSHDALRRRLLEAGADYLYDRNELFDTASLFRAVLEPSADHRIRAPRPDVLARLGITEQSRVNAFVEHARDSGITAAFGVGSKKAGPFPTRSRWWNEVRRQLAEVGRIEAVNQDGSRPRRRQTLPSVAQLRRVYLWATRIAPGETV